MNGLGFDVPITILDQFCGAGGSTTAAVLELESRGFQKIDLRVVNHNEVAIASHSVNHPDAEHFCSNVYRLGPREVLEAGRKLDLMMSSPTCTFFSKSRGGRPVSYDQRYGRMTPWQVYRWAKELQPTRIIVENVEEFLDWGPICRRTTSCKEHDWEGPEKPGDICGQRRKEREGCYFRRWFARMLKLGYRGDSRVLNAANFGDATTRTRLYVQFRNDGKDIQWPRETHSKDGSGDLFGPKKKWRGAIECLDLSRPGRSIFSGKRLADTTLERIYGGIVDREWPEPFVHALRCFIDRKPLPDYVQVDDEEAERVGPPIVARTDMHKSNASCVRDASEPLATVATSNGFGIVSPVASVPPPMIFQANQSRERIRGRGVRGAEEPFQTITATGTDLGIAEAFMLSQASGGAARPVSEPAPTIATDGAHAIVAPYYGNAKCQGVEEPLPTATTKDRFAIVMPVTHADGSNRARDARDPFPTVTAARRGELAFIAAQFGEREGQKARTHSLESPLPTLCAKGRVQVVFTAGTKIDIRFRLAQPDELAAAMSFPEGYVLLGTKEDATRQIGNAVAVKVMRALVASSLWDVLEHAPELEAVA